MTPVGLVASGHPATTAAAAHVLRAGGNAFDATVAAGFAAAVAEPCLTSLAGGGFLLARTADGDEVLFDFFVSAPGLPPHGQADPSDLVCVPIRFGHAVQDFHVGPASVAVPGVLAGYLHVHERLGRLDLARVVEPAVRLAREGTQVDPFLGQLLGLLDPILSRTAVGRELFFRHERVLRPGERFLNPGLGDFLADIGAGHRSAFHQDELGGVVGAPDLAAYRVAEREPLRTTYRGAQVLANPAPSFGGRLVAHALGALEEHGPLSGRDDPATTVRLASALEALAGHRRSLGPGSSRGTTHQSVADAEGNLAAMTTSNGSGSGEFAGGTGVQLNNVMGEEDLHIHGLGSAVPGERIGSMMSPTIVMRAGGHPVAFGSGGSERIRSALTLVAVDLVDHHLDLSASVAAPRMHWDGSRMQVEPGLAPAALHALRERWTVNEWSSRDLYFGGVHGVEPPGGAVGDLRRGGQGEVVDQVP